jgi:hypothetical protein
MNSPNYAVTYVDPYFGNTFITVLPSQAEAERLVCIFNSVCSEVSEYYTTTETDAPAQHATARAYLCSIPDWDTREAFFAELAALSNLEAASNI